MRVPSAEGTSTSQWYVTTYGIPRSIAMEPAYWDARRDVAADAGPGPKERFFPDDRPRVDRGVDPHLHIVSHDHPELPEAGVDIDPAPHDLDRRLVEPQVRDLRAGSEVAPFP